MSSGPDWVLLRKLAVVAFVCVTLYSFAPWARCTFHHMDAAQMDVLGEADRGGAVRAERGTAFVGGFFGSVRGCWASYPVGDDSPWQWPAILGTFLAIGMFDRLERMRYARQIKRMTSDYETVPRKPRRTQPEPLTLDTRPTSPPASSAPRDPAPGADLFPPRSDGKRDGPDWEWDP